jgi:RimJ/RimL family protein N-acetyltransferase
MSWWRLTPEALIGHGPHETIPCMTSDRVAPWPVFLSTDRLRLRPIEAADVPAISRMWTDPAVRRYLGGPVQADRVARREELCVGADNVFSVQRRSDGAIVGMISIEPAGNNHGQTEVSYQLLPEYWGNGYGREAVSAAVAWALEEITPAPPVVIAVTQEANGRSRRLLESIGTKQAGTFAEWDALQVMYSVDRAGLCAVGWPA